MSSEVRGHTVLSLQRVDGAGVSRRLFLGSSAACVSAVLVSGSLTGCASAQVAPAIPDWTTADIPSQRGRRIMITGGNGYPREGRSGLGYHDALALARAGADVIIASRKQELGDEAVRRIKTEAPGATIRFEPLDLANLASVKAFCARLLASGQRIDTLINNAGVMGRLHREVSVDGFERVFATNAIGHFALTASLLPLLKQGQDPRIVWVSSSRISNAIIFDDLQQEKAYDYGLAYNNSKLAILLLAFELERRSKASGWGITSIAVHPGVARTSLIPDGPGLDSMEGRRFSSGAFPPAEEGALSTLYAASAPQASGGVYYGPRGRESRGMPAVAQIPDQAQNLEAATRLWSELEKLTGTSFA